MQVKTLLSVVAQNFWLPSFSSLHNFYLNIPITISRKKKSLKKWNFRANTVIFVFSKTLQLHQTWSDLIFLIYTFEFAE